MRRASSAQLGEMGTPQGEFCKINMSERLSHMGGKLCLAQLRHSPAFSGTGPTKTRNIAAALLGAA